MAHRPCLQTPDSWLHLPGHYRRVCDRLRLNIGRENVVCVGDSLISCWFCFFLCLEGEEGCPSRSVAAGGMCGISLQPPARPGSGRPYLLITGRCIWAERGLAVEGWTFTGHPSWGKLPVRSSALAFGGLLCGQHRCHNTLWPQSRSSSGARPGLVQLVSTEPGPIEGVVWG